MSNYVLSAFADEYSQDARLQATVLKEHNIGFIEIRGCYDKNISALSMAELAEIKKIYDTLGIKVSSVGSPIGKVKVDTDINEYLEFCRGIFEKANFLGSRLVRVFSFYPTGDKFTDGEAKSAREKLGKIISLAEEYGLLLCHENEADILGESPEACYSLLREFDGRLGCVFDMGNFVLGGYSAREAYSLLKPYITYLHIKDALYAGAVVPAGLGEADIEYIVNDFMSYSGEDFFATLEPHLQTFSGLNALAHTSFDNPYKYPSCESAFVDDIIKFKEIFGMKTMKKDKLTANIYATRSEMGAAAAFDIKNKICELLSKKAEINMIFAAAPSQNEVLASLVSDKDIDFSRINAYHMDEYIGLPSDAPQGFGNFLKEHIFGKVPFKSVNYINISAKDAEAEAERYGKLIENNPTDIVVLGIGENGHIAFNDPPVADFSDKAFAKPVELDEVCRNQQVNDGCFKTISDVPTHAITLTVPALTRAQYMFCIVPAKTKAKAVYETMTGEISTACPATILRTHDNAILYLDADSASLLK